MKMHKQPTPDVPLVVLDDDALVATTPRPCSTGTPVAVVSSNYYDVVPFMLRNNGHTVALVADVDDTTQLAEAILIVEQRLGHVAAVIRYETDLATAPHRNSVHSIGGVTSPAPPQSYRSHGATDLTAPLTPRTLRRRCMTVDVRPTTVA